MIKFTNKDICLALEAPKHRVRAWVSKEPFKSRSTSARKARSFDVTDLIILSIAKTLEDDYQLRLNALDNILPAVNTYLRRPQNNDERLIFINLSGCVVESARNMVSLDKGYLIDISDAKETIASYLGLTPIQTELSLGLLPLKHAQG